MTLGLALVASIAGVSTLFVSWQTPHRWKALGGAAGWLLIAASAVPWVRHAGVEFGVAYLAIAVALAAWTWIVITRDTPRAARPDPPRAEGPRPTRAAARQTLLRLLVAIPLAGTASLLAAVAFIVPLRWGAADRYVLAILIAPIVWAGLAIWAGVMTRLLRAAAVLAIIAATASAILFAF